MYSLVLSKIEWLLFLSTVCAKNCCFYKQINQTTNILSFFGPIQTIYELIFLLKLSFNYKIKATACIIRQMLVFVGTSSLLCKDNDPCHTQYLECLMFFQGVDLLDSDLSSKPGGRGQNKPSNLKSAAKVNFRL